MRWLANLLYTQDLNTRPTTESPRNSSLSKELATIWSVVTAEGAVRATRYSSTSLMPMSTNISIWYLSRSTKGVGDRPASMHKLRWPVDCDIRQPGNCCVGDTDFSSNGSWRGPNDLASKSVTDMQWQACTTAYRLRWQGASSKGVQAEVMWARGHALQSQGQQGGCGTRTTCLA